jgi:hypothetical protein
MTPFYQTPGFSLLLIEGGLTLVMMALAFCCPQAGSSLFAQTEVLLGCVARRRKLAILLCGAVPCSLRLLMLPIWPIPHPWIQDDFSFLLAADTFVSGRLTNPTHPMWMHFESFHIDWKPTYMSMYFPAQGMILAAGKLIAGHPWFGVWASCGLMCAALCWALQGWLPSSWALLGGMLAALRLGLFSYWMDTYTGGAVAATGGALVLGALPRILKGFRARDFFWMALGLAVLATSRPYEGLLVSVPAVAAIAWSLWKRPHPAVSVLARRMAPASAVLAGTLLFLGYYNHRLYGSAFTLPYEVNRQTYAVAQHFLWQPLRQQPVYRHRAMQNFYAGTEFGAEMYWYREETQSPTGYLTTSVKKLFTTWFFLLNFGLAPLLVTLPWAVRDRRIRILVFAGLVVAVGLAVETWFIPHYLAPATALLYVILLQCMRHLRVWKPWGLFLVRAMPVLCVILALLRTYASQLHIDLPKPQQATQSWYGAGQIGLERARVAAELESHPGPQLAIVRYVPDHLYPEWVYNRADIDHSKLIWAREMDTASNLELLRYFKNRTAWLVEPDRNPPRVSPYIMPENSGATPVSKVAAAPTGEAQIGDLGR